MLCTCTEVLLTSKHIMNLLTNFMTPELLQVASSGDLIMKGIDSPRTMHCRRQGLTDLFHVF